MIEHAEIIEDNRKRVTIKVCSDSLGGVQHLHLYEEDLIRIRDLIDGHLSKKKRLYGFLRTVLIGDK